MFQKLNEYLDRFAKLGIPGYDCVIYHRGSCVYRRKHGYRDYEKQHRIAGDEIYNLYSATKPITCVTALTLYEKGAFALEDPLGLYLPEFADMQVKDGNGTRPAAGQIRILDLFNMTAGFSYNLESKGFLEGKYATGGRCPTREMMRYLAAEPLEFDPGTRWNYSLCHDVLAALVEELAGMRFGDYVKQVIFDPLYMAESTFHASDADAERRMAQYRYDEATGRYENCGKEIVTFVPGPCYESGGAGCISTVDDYMRFLEALRQGDRILGADTTAMMYSDRLDDESRKSYDWEHLQGYGYGLGVRCPLPGGRRQDYGWGGAAGAFLAVNPVREYSLFYAQQVLDSPVRLLRGELVTYVDEIFG